MIKVSVLGESRYPVDRRRVRRVVAEALGAAGLTSVEAAVLVVGKRKMRELLDRYLKDGVDHEVLTFAYGDLLDREKPFVFPPDGVLRLGDIVVCYPEAVRLAREKNVSVDREVISLVGHGCEHLLGRRHI